MSKVTMPEPAIQVDFDENGDAYIFAKATDEPIAKLTALGEGVCDVGQGFLTTTQAEAYADARVRVAQHWQPIETAPKDCPILAYCDHEADPYHTNDPGGRLTLYAAHYEGLSHCGTGIHIVEWGGAWDDRTYEDSSGGFMPDWWFVAGSEFEVAANPTHWMPLPAPPTE